MRTLMIIRGVLSLAGLIGVPLDKMQIRNFGITGYVVIAPIGAVLLPVHKAPCPESWKSTGSIPDVLVNYATSPICEQPDLN